MIRVLYFARLREKLGLEAEELPLEGLATAGDLASQLAQRGSVWADQFAGCQPMMVAINQEMGSMDSELSDGDEVAFFPPVTGG